MRKVKDAVDLSTNEKFYFTGHANATYMSDGRTVEDAINNISTGTSSSHVDSEDLSVILDYINDETEMQEAIELVNQING